MAKPKKSQYVNELAIYVDMIGNHRSCKSRAAKILFNNLHNLYPPNILLKSGDTRSRSTNPPNNNM